MKVKYAKAVILFGVLLAASARAQRTPHKLTSHFNKQSVPAAPDYNNPAHWAALPDKRDAADSIPRKTPASDSTLAPRALNPGGVGQNFTFVESPVDAPSHRGLLWIGKLYIPGAAFVRIVKVWHQADYNFFWMNVRENVAARVAAFVR